MIVKHVLLEKWKQNSCLSTEQLKEFHAGADIGFKWVGGQDFLENEWLGTTNFFSLKILKKSQN